MYKMFVTLCNTRAWVCTITFAWQRAPSNCRASSSPPYPAPLARSIRMRLCIMAHCLQHRSRRKTPLPLPIPHVLIQLFLCRLCRFPVRRFARGTARLINLHGVLGRVRLRPAYFRRTSCRYIASRLGLRIRHSRYFGITESPGQSHTG